jgi:DNA modification methylase
MRINLTHQSWPIGKFIEYDKNPRRNDHAVEQIAAAIEYFGFRIPIVAKSDGTVVDGHLRLKAARKLGMIKVPVVLADDMTDEQIRGFRISVNKMSELADWDEDLLRAELLDLQGIEFDMDLLGFDVETLEDLLYIKPERDDSKDDDVPEPPADPVSNLGDLWICGKNRVLCGDSTLIDDVEKLMDGKKADMVFTDPPYGLNWSGGTWATNKIYLKIKEWDVLIDQSTIDFILKLSDKIILWGANYYYMPPSRCWLSFRKTNALKTGSDFELAWTNFDKCSKEFAAACNSEGKRQHPTQKPVSLITWAFENYGDNCNIILDLFLGSGSTLIAAEKTNRICNGLEISPAYVDVIVNRWQTYTNQQAILEATGQTFDALREAKFSVHT